MHACTCWHSCACGNIRRTPNTHLLAVLFELIAPASFNQLLAQQLLELLLLATFLQLLIYARSHLSAQERIRTRKRKHQHTKHTHTHTHTERERERERERESQNSNTNMNTLSAQAGQCRTSGPQLLCQLTLLCNISQRESIGPCSEA